MLRTPILLVSFFGFLFYVFYALLFSSLFFFFFFSWFFFSSFFLLTLFVTCIIFFLVIFFPPDCCYCIYIIANENGSGGIHFLDTQDSNGLASSRWAVVFRSCRVWLSAFLYCRWSHLYRSLFVHPLSHCSSLFCLTLSLCYPLSAPTAPLPMFLSLSLLLSFWRSSGRKSVPIKGRPLHRDLVRTRSVRW